MAPHPPVADLRQPVAEFAGPTSNFPFTGWSGRRRYAPDGGPRSNDYTRITVTVTAPTLDSTVQRTITIAAER